MRRIGLLGGTFDPIHRGHLRLAGLALEQFRLDQVWFLPAGDPYYKTASDNITKASLRLEMTKACIERYKPRFAVSDIEIRRSGRTYTADTVEYLNEMYEDCDFFFIIGQDTLNHLEGWHEPERIFRNCTILCAGRKTEEGSDDLEAEILRLTEKFKDSSARIFTIVCGNYDLSSTEIRNAVKEGKDISKYVTKPVERFIRDHALYL